LGIGVDDESREQPPASAAAAASTTSARVGRIMSRDLGQKVADRSGISYYDGARVKRLDGKIAIVTGGARGIGRAIVETFAAEGATVAVFDVDESGAQDVARDLAGRGFAVEAHGVDVTTERSVADGVRRVLDRHRRVDVLVNNAGVNAYFDATTMTLEEWQSVFAVDLTGAWLCAKHVLPGMVAQGHGAIVNIASIHASLSLALDYAPRGIRVNVVSPGWTQTHLVEEWFARQPDPHAARAAVVGAHPLQRIASPREIANVVAFVASDDASAMTGAEVSVDCGLGARFAT
jgi:NAD(P)-dependent dehydrogenase (short-subunit alcohol dehydrogenase family)